MKTDKQRMKILEEAYSREISAALGEMCCSVYQSRVKLVKEMVKEGLLMEVTETLKGFPPVKITGVVLTELGRLTYCSSC